MEILSDLKKLTREIKAGNYGARLQISQISDENVDLAECINEILSLSEKEIKAINLKSKKNSEDILKKCLSECSKVLHGIAEGDLLEEFHISLPDDNRQDLEPLLDEISQFINKSRMNFQVLKKDINQIILRLKDGDFVSNIDLSQYSGEFRIVADGLNQISALTLSELKNLFGLVNEKIEELSLNVNQVRESVQEVAHNSEKVARNSRAVSDNTEQSDAGVRQVLRAMEDLSVTVGDVSQKAESVSRLAHEGTQMSRKGSEYAKKAEEGMMHIITSAEEADHLITEMQGDMKKINDIVKFITDIANQTNLLALNAAIEAARAGEMGRGFAVVASEVKTLALESRKSAEKITDMVNNLQKQAQKAVNSVSLATDAVREGNVLLSDTLGIFGSLGESVEDISMNIEQVASMNEEQAAAVEEITSSMHEVSAMLKDTAREASESATATDETSVSVSNLRGIINQVSNISENISVSMKKFIV